MSPADPHSCRGKIASYVLKLDGDEQHDFYIYCGYSADIELRMLACTGIRPKEQAGFCKLHPPTEILSVKLHETEEEAVLAECANFNLWAGKLGSYDRVRGGRLNMAGPAPYPPRGWPRNQENLAPQINEESPFAGT